MNEHVPTSECVYIFFECMHVLYTTWEYYGKCLVTANTALGTWRTLLILANWLKIAKADPPTC